MRVGWVGLGKLGLPCALAMASRGHEVVGYDPHPADLAALCLYEQHLTGLAELHHVPCLASVADVVAASDLVFVAVQTPHEPALDGTHVDDGTRADFEVGYLRSAVREVCETAKAQRRTITLAVVSTVLPGTWSRIVEPLLNPFVQGAYTPSLIAMGTTVADWLRPEMVILGTDDPHADTEVRRCFREMHDQPIVKLRPVEAELLKQAYNSFIGLKITYANWLAEICWHVGADVDAVTDALAQATDRIISPKYLRAGMGDGGGCHPRDNLALSWLAQRFGLSVDVAGFAMAARERQTRWLADLARHWAAQAQLPIVLAGTEYKADVPLTAGSPALLLEELLADEAPLTLNLTSSVPNVPAVYVITANHSRWPKEAWPAGSVVLDPWGYIPDAEGITVVRIGRAR